MSLYRTWRFPPILQLSMGTTATVVLCIALKEGWGMEKGDGDGDGDGDEGILRGEGAEGMEE